jgi:hypothetical protein
MSPTLHRHDSVNKVIQAAAAVKLLGTEIRLVPRTIPYGKDDQKTTTNAIKVQTNHASIHRVCELLIEIFEAKHDAIPQDVYFVPSPANGAMSHDLFFDHLRLHHQYTADLRSFAITNVRDLQAELTIPDPTTGTMITTTFESALLTSVKHGTSTRIFTSIEPTKTSETDGHYLMVTNKELINNAQECFDQIIAYMMAATPDNIVRITRSDHSSVSRANSVVTSSRFKSYTSTLQTMIPSTITTSPPPPNAWKRRPPVTLNLTDDKYPALNSLKKQRRDANTTMTDHSTNFDTADTPSLTTINLDEIENSQRALRAELQQQIDDLRKATENMQKELHDSFALQMGQLELRIEGNTKRLMNELGLELQKALQNMTVQADRTDEMFKEFRQDVSKQIADQMSHQTDLVLAAIKANQDGTSTPKIGNTPKRPDKKPRANTTFDMMNIDFRPTGTTQADGSLNPTASRAITPSAGSSASAGA